MKYFQLLTVSLFSCLILAGQNAPIDFEAGGQGANWTWTVFENDDNPPVNIIANPDVSGENTSATVAEFTARVTGAPWVGCESMHGSDLGAFTLDTANSWIKILVWKPVISNVGIKLVTPSGAALPEILIPNTQTNKWEELTFNFSSYVNNGPYAAEDVDQIVIFPDFNGRTQENVIYFDNIRFEAPDPNFMPGCTDPTASNYNAAANSEDGSCLYSMTFNVNMLCDTGTFSQVELTGPFTGWCAGCLVLTDPDGDFIYSITTDVPGGELEYKYSIDMFAGQEDLVDDVQAGIGACAPITDGATYANRTVTVSAGGMTNDSYGTCGTCDPNSSPGCIDPVASNYDPTADTNDGSCVYAVNFNVDMNCEMGNFSQVELTGPFTGWCAGCIILDDTDGDGVYSTTIDLPIGDFEYKYSIDNFAGQENLVDDVMNGTGSCAPITDGQNFANRLVQIFGLGDFYDTYGTCGICDPNNTLGCMDSLAVNFNPAATLDDGSCSYAVTFSVDMNDVTDPFTTPEVNGTFNGWCGNCNPMSDPDGDGIWKAVINLQNGYYDFKFSADAWNIEEMLTDGSECTMTTDGFVNRALTVTGPTEYGPAPWGQCASTCPEDITGDGTIDVNDFLALNSQFGNSCTGCPEDITDDGVIDVNDFLSLNSVFDTDCN